MQATFFLVATLAMLLGSAAASAQVAPDGDGWRGRTATWGLPAFKGRVDVFTLSPRGAVDGMVLADGLEVKTPPHLSRAILGAVRRGDVVTVRGLKAASLALVQAASIEDETSGQTVIDAGPGAQGPSPDGDDGAPRPASARRVEGRIRQVLHGARGDVNGVLLEDSTVVRLPPPDASRLAALLVPGQGLVVDGRLSTSPVGSMIEASALGASADRMNPMGLAVRAGGRR